MWPFKSKWVPMFQIRCISPHVGHALAYKDPRLLFSLFNQVSPSHVTGDWFSWKPVGDGSGDITAWVAIRDKGAAKAVRRWLKSSVIFRLMSEGELNIKEKASLSWGYSDFKAKTNPVDVE